ncbi:MAG: extracellular solute-binding protein, partial [Clostridia bacterium]|nr:extracellular solute-binding protein [Clostridia bacterium]
TETKKQDDGKTSETESDSSVETIAEPAIAKRDRDTVLSVLHWTVNESWIPWEEICLYDFTGDSMDDAIYGRTSELKEYYGITLENEYMNCHEMIGKIKTMVSSNADEYQMIVERTYQMQFLMTEDVFANLGTMSHVDLSQPYWTRDSVNTFTFGGVTLFAASDMLLMDKSSTAAVIFNTSIANDHGWGGTYFYDKVKDKEWTLEELVDCAADAYVDLDGDTKVSSGDIFGAQGGDDPVHFIFNGAGELFCRNTGDDKFLEYTFEKERCYDVVTDTLELLLYEDWYISDRTASVENAFTNNQVLFDITRVETVNKYRIMEQDYGILPIPLYDDVQNGQYYSEISPHHDSVLAIPHTATANDEQEEAIGAALEELAYISHLTVYPVLYDVVISGKGTRDQESKEMLKIIFDSRVYDIGIIYDFATFANITLRMAEHGKHNIVSEYEGCRKTIEIELGQVVEQLHSLVD